MRIRSGFVSNSSSTSFVLISKEELTLDAFARMAGVDSDSPLYPLFVELHECVLSSIAWQGRADGASMEKDIAQIESKYSTELSEKIKSKWRDGIAEGRVVAYGNLDSDASIIEGFFACESFELEDESNYFNALECSW